MSVWKTHTFLTIGERQSNLFLKAKKNYFRLISIDSYLLISNLYEVFEQTLNKRRIQYSEHKR